MATTVVQVGEDWVLVEAGPRDAISIQATSREIQYRLDASEPAAGARGHILNPEAGHTVEISSGENLYARSSSGDTNLVRTV